PRPPPSRNQQCPEPACDTEPKPQPPPRPPEPRVQPQKPEPLETKPDGDAGPRRRRPGGAGDRPVGPPCRDVRRHGDGAWGARVGAGAEGYERHRGAPLDLCERDPGAAPLSERVAQQRSPSPEDECAVRR